MNTSVANYGGSSRTSREDIESQLKKHYDGLWYQLSLEQQNMMTTMMFWTLDAAVPSCMKFLKYFRSLLAYVLKHKDCVSFTNPLTGFPTVLRSYVEEKIRLSYDVRKRKCTIILNRKTNETDINKTKSSSVPGIIHSADAALLIVILGAVPELNCTYIHDSIGVHPNHINEVKDSVLNAMQELSKSDYFENIRAQLMQGCPPNPEFDSVPHVGDWTEFEEDIKHVINGYM